MKKTPLEEAVKDLIRAGKVGTQEEIVSVLLTEGFEVNQSKISRLLRKLGTMKVKGSEGRTIYSLPKEPAPPSTKSTLANLILDISANEALVIVQTSPGSAPVIGRMIDYHKHNSAILGTIAGDDTIFVAPRSIKHIQKTLQEVKTLLLRPTL